MVKLAYGTLSMLHHCLCIDGSVSSIFAGTEMAYERVSPTLMMCQMLAVLEIVNTALGLVKGGVLPTFMQVQEEGERER